MQRAMPSRRRRRRRRRQNGIDNEESRARRRKNMDFVTITTMSRINIPITKIAMLRITTSGKIWSPLHRVGQQYSLRGKQVVATTAGGVTVQARRIAASVLAPAAANGSDRKERIAEDRPPRTLSTLPRLACSRRPYRLPPVLLLPTTATHPPPPRRRHRRRRRLRRWHLPP